MAALLIMLESIVVASATGILLIYLFYKRQFSYWSRRNIPHTSPNFPMGDLGEANRTKPIGQVFKEIYDRFHDRPFVGLWMFHRPALLVRSPTLIKHMLVQDFQHFQDHGNYADEEGDPLSAHLFSLKGSKWRNLRVKLTPTFTSGKMKMMFPTLLDCSRQLTTVLDKPSSLGETIELKEILCRFTTDVIASCAFGIEANALKDPNAIFLKMGRKIFEPTFSVAWRNTLSFMAPDLSSWLKLRITPHDVSDFFIGAFKETYEYREKNQVRRNDFMDLLIQLNTKGYLDDVDAAGCDEHERPTGSNNGTQTFTMEQAAAQAFVFFLAGFETSATTMQFTLYELAVNPVIQDKVRDEIRRVLDRHNGQITYDALMDMAYLERIIFETLRKYPPAPLMERRCTKEYRIPDTDLVLEKGSSVQFSLQGLHYDPEYYPNPTIFDPDRFTEEEKSRRPNFTFLPFGEGPRVCIGQRFGLMQIRVGLVTLLSHFQFEVSKKTVIPIVLEPKSFVMLPQGGMHLKITKLLSHQQ